MWRFKEGLTSENNELVAHNERLYELYRQQPKRKFCKICHGTKRRFEFHSHGVLYYCCDECGHINGNHVDTEEYCKKLYESDDGCFGAQYEDIDMEAYLARMKTIYLPKAEFLRDAIVHMGGTNASGMKFLDVGAGSGHFVYAMNELGLDASGIDVDVHQVRHAQKILTKGMLEHCPSENMVNYISNVNADVLTCIYAFEHITNVVEVFDAIQKNKRIQWVYFAVPMLAYTSMLESVNPKVYARVLHAAHTHIYTEESIAWLCKKYNWEPVGDWRFGSDAADVLRTIMVELELQGDVQFAQFCKEKYVDIIDDLQYVMDKHGCCSDIHILVKKNNP